MIVENQGRFVAEGPTVRPPGPSRARGMPAARTLEERYSPDTGVPLRIGQVWPPRLVIHSVVEKDDRDDVSVVPSVWFRHLLIDALEVAVRPSDEPAVDSEGRTMSGLKVGRTTGLVESSRSRGVPLAPGESSEPYRRLSLPMRWNRRFARDIQTVSWVRKPLFLELSDGHTRRIFQWYLYLTPGPAELPGRQSVYDDLPHFRWVEPETGPVVREGVAPDWIELPPPLAGPHMPPACWVQPSNLDPGAPEEPEGGPSAANTGPHDVDLVPVYPVEPPVPPGIEAVGWNGALGGHDPRPAVQALAVRSRPRGGTWVAPLRYWDTPADESSRPVRHPDPTELEPPTSCVWPRVMAEADRPLVLYDLVRAAESRVDDETHVPCEVRVNFEVQLPDDAEAVLLERADIRLGSEPVGRWEEGPVELQAGQTRNLRCTVDLRALRDAADGRLKLSLAFQGRPTRGLVRGPQGFRTENGPYVRLMRSRTDDEGAVRTPWLVIDLGTEGTCAAVAFLDGFVPRVINVQFDEGPIYPSRVYLAPALGGVYTLTEEPSEDALYTTLIKLGLRFGDGAHPGCPDHIAATEVARFFLKRFLLEVRERMAWFPLQDADVLVSFPPRLAAMPRFVRSLHDTFSSVLEEVLWREGSGRKLFFREEAFLVAVPSLYRDLQVSPVEPGRSRYYWVMDFGGGTTDVCGFQVKADEWGEEHVVSHLTYPQRLPHHLCGNDVTRAFYAALYQHLADVGVVAGPDVDESQGEGRRFPLPPDPLPSARSSPTALTNQTTLRELADALKCLPAAEQQLTVRQVARDLQASTLRTVDGVATTLAALLAGEASHLGELLAADLHAEVLDPSTRRAVAARAVQRAVHLDPTRKTPVHCVSCGSENKLPMWVFASNRAFRFRCRACGHAQRVQLEETGILPDDADPEAPTITDYRDHTVQSVDREVEEGELYLEQDGRTYVIRDFPTLRRWVEERRVGPDDLLSEGGISWTPLRDRKELRDLFRAAEVVAVDTTQEVPRDRWQRWMFPEPDAEQRADPPMLGRDIRLFLDACREALERAVEQLEDAGETEVVVLVAGRGSLFVPIAEGVQAFLPGRVVHLTNDWVRRSYGTAGQIDAGADLKTMTVNGGGLFALLHANPETSHLLLSVDTQLMDVPVYLQSTTAARPWRITERLELRSGRCLPIVNDPGGPSHEVGEPGETVEEPPPRALPLDTPLTGDLQLVVDGLPEDRGWEPYIVIAQGTARRKHGRRARTLPETGLYTEERDFVLAPLTQEVEVRFARMLPRLPLLGAGPSE